MSVPFRTNPLQSGPQLEHKGRFCIRTAVASTPFLKSFEAVTVGIPSSPRRVVFNLRTLLVLVCAGMCWVPADGRSQPKPMLQEGTLAKDEPQAIYSDKPSDPWNVIFHCLFTRTLTVRLSEDFPDGAPFSPDNVGMMAVKRASTRTFERIEGGDRAIEPLYPHEQFRSDVGAAQLLDEPRFSRIQKALADALAEQAPRTPLTRALMQADLWAAYDFLARDVSDWILPGAPIPLFRERQAKLRRLLAPLIRKLALTSEEIRALPDNYASAGRKLPDLFAPDSEWMEVLWFPDREHERAAWHRRVARVFIKPLVRPLDKTGFLQSAIPGNIHTKVEATALVIQNLLVDTDGKAVPSPLTYSVQTRTLGGGPVATSFAEFELSRRELLKNPAGGGLVDTAALPTYLPGAANDHGYASRILIGRKPIAVLPATRCAACHTGHPIFTFAILAGPAAPGVRLLASGANEHAASVASAKMKEEAFKRLLADWE